MHWVGSKKLAFIPVYRPQIEAPPPDWIQQIEQRIYFDPDANGADVSLRAHIVKTSNGRADLEGHVLQPVEINRIDVPPDALAGQYESSLRSQGFEAAAIVMLGMGPAGTADGARFWVRFVMGESVGTWAMEFIHVITGLGDLRSFGDIQLALESYDNMSCACDTHPSSYTKRDIGWLDPQSFTRQAARSAIYSLHSTGLTQPAPAGRTTAVEVGADVPVLMLEARQKVDQFDDGIRGEGVIVYELIKRETGATPGFRRPHIELRTYKALIPGETFTSAGGVKVQVLAKLVGGYSVVVEDPSFHLVDRSGSLGAPKAASPVTVTQIPGLTTYNIAYRDGSGNLHELWQTSAGGVGTTDLTANAGAPDASGTPFAYCDTSRSQEILLFRDGGGTVRSLYWSTGAVGHDNLSGTAQSPKASGDPVGYYVAGSDMHHVIYRGSGGHLHELWWAGVAPVAYGGDLTALANAPAAAGDPAAYVDPARATNIVVYRGNDNRIHSLYWTDGPVGHDNLSGTAGTPPAQGDPAAYYTAHDDTHQVVYRSDNGHLYELYWRGVAPVVGWDLTAQAGSPPAASDPSAYYHAVENTKHVIYRSSDGKLHELWWVPGGGVPAHVDLTNAYAAPKAADNPIGFSVPWLGTQHVAYRGTDGHVYELIW